MRQQRTSSPIVTDHRDTGWTGLIHRLGAVGSTMAEARELISSPHGTVVVAREQHGGQGRAGRRWISPPGNLHATVVLRWDGNVREGPQLSFMVANAAAVAVDRLAGPGTALKWPNDVLRGGAKLAGILLEQTGDGAVLAGIGMNVAHSPAAMPYPVTSLAALGCDADVDTVLAAVLEALRTEWDVWRAQGFEGVLTRWGRRGPVLGSGLVVQLGAERLVGRFAGLRSDGALLLDVAGTRRAVVAGDVQPCATGPEGR